MGLPMSRRTVAAGLAIAILVVAVCLPGITAIDYAVFELPWTLLPDETPAEPPRLAARTDDQPLALRGLLPPRAPPSPVAA